MTVMLVTTCLTSLVMILCWNKPPAVALAFFLFFFSVESLYFSASLIKFLEGAWLPILLALFLMTLMFVWHYATIKKYEFDLHNKVSLDWLLALGPGLGIARVPGIGLVYTDLVSGVPSNFSRFVTNLPAFHRVLVFVCVKSVTVPHVPAHERFLLGRVGPPSHRSYRCIVRYGYRDVPHDVHCFETLLVSRLAQFIGQSSSSATVTPPDDDDRLTVIGGGMRLLQCINEADVDVNVQMTTGMNLEEDGIEMASTTSEALAWGDEEGEAAASSGWRRRGRRVRFAVEESTEEVREELEELCAAREAGMAFIMGHSHVEAKAGSSLLKRAAINIGYNFMQRNCRGPEVALKVPAVSLLEVGMVYVV